MKNYKNNLSRHAIDYTAVRLFPNEKKPWAISQKHNVKGKILYNYFIENHKIIRFNNEKEAQNFIEKILNGDIKPTSKTR